MDPDSEASVTAICDSFGNDPTRLLDILLDVEAQFGHVSDESIDQIVEILGVPRVRVEELVSFYSFLHAEPRGKVVIRLCDDVIDRMRGADRVARGIEEELGSQASYAGRAAFRSLAG